MTSADAAWLHMDRPTNLMVINAVLWFDEPLDWPASQDVFRERVIEQFPRFRQRVVERRPGQAPAWEDDPTFDPALHFHRLRLPAPGDRRALQEVVNDLIRTPLDRTKPLWHIYLLEGYGSGDARAGADAPLHRRRHRARPGDAVADRPRRGAGRLRAAATLTLAASARARRRR